MGFRQLVKAFPAKKETAKPSPFVVIVPPKHGILCHSNGHIVPKIWQAVLLSMCSVEFCFHSPQKLKNRTQTTTGKPVFSILSHTICRNKKASLDGNPDSLLTHFFPHFCPCHSAIFGGTKGQGGVGRGYGVWL